MLRFFSDKLSHFILFLFIGDEETKSHSSTGKPAAVRYPASSFSYESTEAAMGKSLDMQGLVISVKER